MIPPEFSAEYIAEHSSPDEQLYTDFWYSLEPMKSLFEINPWLEPPHPKKPLPDDPARYWNTTVPRKHSYWRDIELPLPSKEIRTLRHDLRKWGYCLIEDGLSSSQCQTFRERLYAQAVAERKAGVDQPTPSGQYVNTLVNKGECFRGCIEHDPKHIQAGAVVEQLLNETLGKRWICHSFLANGADPGGYPQGLHTDQGPLLPVQTSEAPALLNTMFIPVDVDERNGGTLLIPGSHNTMAAMKPAELPPAINLEAKAGTLLVFDGRLLHGTGINRTDKQRFVATMSCVKPWMRQQENWVLSTLPEIVASASDKLLHRMGMQALVYGGTVEGFGLAATGRVGDVRSAIQPFRMAMDQGEYLRVGELSPNSSDSQLRAPYTVRSVRDRARGGGIGRGAAERGND